MRTFEVGMVIVGIALGTYWVHTLRPARHSFFIAAILAGTAVLLVGFLPEGWLRFGVSISQAPLIGLTIANAPAFRRKV